MDNINNFDNIRGVLMSKVEEIVHIIPLGHEFDRVVKPFEKMKANRVYLMTILDLKNVSYISEEMSRRQRYFLDRVKKALEEKGIEVKVQHANIFDMLDVLGKVSRIIRKERERGNIVYVNMSGAGRLTSVAATLAAMAHRAKAYYVVAERYSKTKQEEDEHGLSICKEPKIRYLTNLPIDMPNEISLRLLARLSKEERGMKTKDIVNFLKELGIEDFDEERLEPKVRKDRRRTEQTLLNRLNKKILDKLERKGYIKREKIGRCNIIRVTESGRYMAYLGGFIE